VANGRDSLGCSMAVVAAVNGLPSSGQHKGGSAELPDNEIVRNDPYVQIPGPFEGRITTR
jgi:hypothetical protein